VKLFVLTRVHGPRMHTIRTGLTKLLDTHWVVHTDADRVKLAHGWGVSIKKIYVANPPPDPLAPVAWLRDWTCRIQKLMPLGEWCVWADDNIRRLTCLPEPYYSEDRIDFKVRSSKEWRELYGREATPKRMVALLEDLAGRCQDQGTIYGGFGTQDNYFYRPRHWGGPATYVKTKLAVYRNDGSRWHYFDGCVYDDYCKTADVVARYGSVLVNNFARPENTLWEPGGFGSYQKRYPFMVQTVKEMLALWPGLLKQHSRGPADVTFAIRTRRRIDEWRRQHGYLEQSKTPTGAAVRPPGRVGRGL
jgi:hypothetical protein